MRSVSARNTRNSFDIGRTPIILDSGANQSAAPDSLVHSLSKVTSTQTELETMGGSVMVSQVAELPGVRSGASSVVLARELQGEIILALGGLLDTYKLHAVVSSEDMKFYHAGTDTLVFTAPRRAADGLWGCELASIQQLDAAPPPRQARALLGRTYTAEQKRRAALVDALHNLVHPRDEVLTRQCETGMYSHYGLGASDIKTYREIYGPCPACASAKERIYEGPASLTPPATQPGEKWHTDIFTTDDGIAHLGCIDEHSDLTVLLRLLDGRKTKQSLEEAYSRLLTFTNKYGHRVAEVLGDFEEVLREAAGYLNRRGIYTGHTAPEKHSHRWERKKQTLNDRADAVRENLRFHIPKKGPVTESDLFRWVASQLMFEPTANTEGATPWHLFMHRGNPLVFLPRRQGLLRFGTLVQTKEKHGTELGLIMDQDWTSRAAYRIRYPQWKGSHVTTHTRSADRITVLQGEVPEAWGMSRRLPNADAIRAEPLNATFAALLDSTSLLGGESTQAIGAEDASAETFAVAQEELNPVQSESTSETPNTMAVPQEERADVPTEASEVTPTLNADREGGLELGGDFLGGELTHDFDAETVTELRPLPPRQARSRSWKDGPAYNRRSVRAYFQVVFDKRKHAKSQKQMRWQEYIKHHPERGSESAKAELQNWIDHRTCVAVDPKSLTPDQWKETLRTLAFTKDKLKASTSSSKTGDFDKTKTRLCVDGSRQDKTSIGELYSPTAETTSVFLLLTLLALTGGEAVVYDIKGAFLHAEIPEGEPHKFAVFDKHLAAEYIKLVPEAGQYRRADGSLVVRLLKYAYGLVEAPRKFNLKLVEGLKAQGYVVTKSDRSLLVKRRGEEDAVMVTLHVDDELGIIIGDKMREDLLESLKAIFGSEVECKPADGYLGMTLEYDKTAKVVRLSQQAYWERAMEKYNLQELREYATPAEDDLYEEPEDTTPFSKEIYQSMVMTAQYGAGLTRPDIRLPVVYLATKCQQPTKSDLNKLLRVYGYLKGSIDLKFTLRPKNFELSKMTDAAFAVHHRDQKSHTGIIIMLGGAPIFIRSAKQKSVKISSTGAETAALCEGCTYLLWIKGMLTELGFPPQGPIKVYQDNQSAIAQTRDECAYRRSKQDMIQMAFVRELVADGEIELIHCPTENMTADVLTKPLQGAAFRRHRAKLLGEL
jgi:hypothetical protein